jgi:hypothetical protein
MLSATSPDTPNQTVSVAIALRRESCDRGLEPVALGHDASSECQADGCCPAGGGRNWTGTAADPALPIELQ